MQKNCFWYISNYLGILAFISVNHYDLKPPFLMNSKRCPLWKETSWKDCKNINFHIYRTIECIIETQTLKSNERKKRFLNSFSNIQTQFEWIGLDVFSNECNIFCSLLLTSMRYFYSTIHKTLILRLCRSASLNMFQKSWDYLHKITIKQVTFKSNKIICL